MGLECMRVVVMGEWDFGEQVIPLSAQLLWFEGKAFPITRPQNKDYTGHLLYEEAAPVYIACKENGWAQAYFSLSRYLKPLPTSTLLGLELLALPFRIKRFFSTSWSHINAMDKGVVTRTPKISHARIGIFLEGVIYGM